MWAYIATPAGRASSSKTTRFEWLLGASSGTRFGRAGTQEGHRAGHLLQHVGEVLGAHERVGHRQRASTPSSALAAGLDLAGDHGVVDGHGVALDPLELGDQFVGLGDLLRDPLHPCHDVARRRCDRVRMVPRGMPSRG